MIEVLIVVIVLSIVGFLIIKNYQPVLVLLSGALVLLIGAVILGHPIYGPDEGTGFVFFDIFARLRDTIINQVSSAGLVIMLLFGYSAYMTAIGANQKTVDFLVKPLRSIKSKLLFVPVVFLLGNLMSLVVPSASSLAIILMAILYPLLQGIGISSLTAAGVIAMTATIMPTPLGADNVIAAETLGYNLLTYVGYHARISLPALLIIAIVHFFWQRYCDTIEGEAAFAEIDSSQLVEQQVANAPVFYAILPLLPLVLIIGVGIAGLFNTQITMDIVVLTFIAYFISFIIEIIRNRSFKQSQTHALEMMKGMGQGFSQVVMLVVAGSLFTSAIQALGVIDSLMSTIQESQVAGILTTFIFSGGTALFTILSGSGLAMFYALIELIPDIASKAGIDGILITLPMQMIANLARTISPVAAVIMIVSSAIKVSPVRLLKRTSVPTIVGILGVAILSLILLPR